MKTPRMQNHWYLGLLGVIGFWQFPYVWTVLIGQSADYLDLTNLLWFLWFLYLVPDTDAETDQ